MSTSYRVGVILLLTGAIAAVLMLKNGSRDVADPVPAQSTEASPAVTNLPRLVDLGAGKCIPCKMMAPILEELKSEFEGTFTVDFIDVWEDPDAGEPYDIRIIPTQIFYDGTGEELFRHEGFFSREDILEKWKELGHDMQAGTR